MRQGKLMRFIAAFATASSGLLLAPGSAQAVPSFARQTGFACEACHTVFPELTPFGRRFKLNAYTIDNLPQVSGMSTSKEQTLALNQLPPLSFMLQASYTSTKGALPDSNLVPGDLAKNGQVLLPQQASLFYAGKIAPNFGAFVQMTYDGVDDAFGWDNTDVRYAQTANDKLLWGISFNNNPTVQDPWNTTPAWQSPFDQRSSVAPTPGTSTMLDGSLFDMSTAGLSVYAYFNNSVYAEFGMYHQANHGFGQIDSAVDQPVLNGLAPYWRLAYERQWGRKSWEVGAYGMEAKVYPADGTFALTGPTDKYNDWAVDSQYQFIGDEHLLTLTGTYIDEKQTLDQTFGVLGASSNASNDLKT
ncbi:MAG: cytochrome C, partial [Burkholderiales bacterium]